MVADRISIKGNVKRVLIVDNNKDLLSSLDVGLAKYRSFFSTVYANNGRQALEILKREYISVVVSDVRMPEMNGLELLSNITSLYPEIPVIIVSAYDRDHMEWAALKSGATAFISKPFGVDEIGEKILSLLEKESDGGVIKGMSIGVFMQLAEMDEMTCTIRVSSKVSDLHGVVFFRRGQMLDARCGDLSGEKAIVKILSLDKTHIRIQNNCPDQIKPRIDVGLQAVLLEAMRLKDEALSAGNKDDFTDLPIQEEKISSTYDQNSSFQGGDANSDVSDPKRILKSIQQEIGNRSGFIRVVSDRRWEHVVSIVMETGDLFNAGCLKCGYIQKDDVQANLFIPGSPPAVVKVYPSCPRDKIFRIVRRIG